MKWIYCPYSIFMITEARRSNAKLFDQLTKRKKFEITVYGWDLFLGEVMYCTVGVH